MNSVEDCNVTVLEGDTGHQSQSLAGEQQLSSHQEPGPSTSYKLQIREKKTNPCRDEKYYFSVSKDLKWLSINETVKIMALMVD